MPPAISSAMTMKRIYREISDAKKEDLGAITLAPTQDSVNHWKATIPGPQGSPYEGGVFNVDIHLPADYPFSAPKVTFTTRIYHMNISDKGGICIDILKQNWSPALSLFKVMLSLSSLLTDPNPHDPLVPSIAMEYMRNRAQHDRTARRWTELYAQPPPPPLPSKATPSSATTSNKAKGKEKASTAPMASSSGNTPTIGGSTSSANARSQPLPEPIMIDDSGDERSSSAYRAGRKRRREPDTAGVDLVEEERIRTRRRAPPGQSGPLCLQSSADVIVIDD